MAVGLQWHQNWRLHAFTMQTWRAELIGVTRERLFRINVHVPHCVVEDLSHRCICLLQGRPAESFIHDVDCESLALHRMKCGDIKVTRHGSQVSVETVFCRGACTYITQWKSKLNHQSTRRRELRIPDSLAQIGTQLQSMRRGD